jgi:translation initiation factor IF-1
MSSKQNNSNSLRVEARVLESLPNMLFRVELANGHRSLALITRNLRSKLIQVLPGDKVLIDFSPYDLTCGRIIEKLQPQEG